MKSLRDKYTKNLPDRVADRVRAYPQWSPAERRRMDEIVEEVLDHMRDGTGNAFIRRFVDTWVMKEPSIAAAMRS